MASRRTVRDTGPVRSTPLSYMDRRWAGLVSSQTAIRLEPPTMVVRILVGLSQLTWMWAIPPPASGIVR